MSGYLVETMEREYNKPPFKANSFFLSEKRFNEFINSVTISKDVDEETGEILDTFKLTFNSGLRHTACKVRTISIGKEIIYNYGEGDSYVCKKTFHDRLEAAMSKKEKAA